VWNNCGPSRCKSSEWRERVVNRTDVGSLDQTAAQSLLRTLLEQFRRQTFARAIIERTPRAGHGDGAKPRSIFDRHVCMVQNDIPRHSEASRLPRGRQCQVDVCREDIR
jgi:hypothetical protein